MTTTRTTKVHDPDFETARKRIAQLRVVLSRDCDNAVEAGKIIERAARLASEAQHALTGEA